MTTPKRSFLVVLRQDEEGGYGVTCPELPAAISGGKTREEALENIREAIELCLESGDVPLEVAQVSLSQVRL